MTIGTDQSPFDRYRVRAASLTIWSNAGWMKSANWISAIGMSPLRAAPIATPTMADSASGVSRTRASPKRAYRPSVAPKTPPLRPTSSPRTRTRSSRSISSVIAARTASIMRISGMSKRIVARSTVMCAGRQRFGGRLQMEEGGRSITFLEVRDFVLGGGQERDGWASTGTALLSAERAARHLLRLAWSPSQQPHRPFRLFLPAPQRSGAQGRAARPRRRADGRQVPRGQDPQADVVLHRARAAPRARARVHPASRASPAGRRVRPQGDAPRPVPGLWIGERAEHALPPGARRADC